MSTYQKVIIIGFLGDEPQTKHFEGGGQITNLSVATTENWKDKQTGEKRSLTEWHRVSLNGKLSELADKYLNKGSKVLIEGTLRTRKWTDGNNIERYTTEINGRNMTFMGSKDQSSNTQQNTGSAVDAYNQNKQTNEPIGEQDDDLPF